MSEIIQHITVDLPYGSVATASAPYWHTLFDYLVLPRYHRATVLMTPSDEEITIARADLPEGYQGPVVLQISPTNPDDEVWLETKSVVLTVLIKPSRFSIQC